MSADAIVSGGDVGNGAEVGGERGGLCIGSERGGVMDRRGCRGVVGG